MTNNSWRCIFVEPVPWLLDKCRETYGSNTRFKFVNAAINGGSSAPFYYVEPTVLIDNPDLPEFVLQIGSFNKKSITGYQNGVLIPYLRCIEVVGFSYKQLLEKCGIDKVDLLHIDAEGYDWSILKQINFSENMKQLPRVILFEIHNLKSQELNDAKLALSDSYYLKIQQIF